MPDTWANVDSQWLDRQELVFQVSDPALLDKVQAVDKVRFAAVNDAGKLTVTQIQPAK